jgi:hypothetical protein
MRVAAKPAVVYALFVGVPLLTLVGVLRAGRGLGAPTSIGGRWHLEGQEQVAAALKCGRKPDSDDEPWFIEIGQSGQRLTVQFHDGAVVLLRGRIEGATLDAHASSRAAPGAALKAQVNRDGDGVRLVGTLDVVGCPIGDGGHGDAAQVPFRAVRERAGSGGGPR